LQGWAAGATDAPGDALLQSKKLQLLALVAGLDRGGRPAAKGNNTDLARPARAERARRSLPRQPAR
jgi:hypothetical protein